MSPALLFEKGLRRAVEIVCIIDSEFVWSQTARTSAELRDELRRIEQDFLTRGWAQIETPS